MRELLAFFEKFYGEKYTGIFLDIMTDYLEGYSEEFYLAVQKVMVLRFSRIYNKVPGPAEIEKHMAEILNAMPKPKELPEPEIEKGTKEGLEYLSKIKEIFRLKKGTEPKILVQEGGNYCMRTAKELKELRKNRNYNGAVINITGEKQGG